MRFTSTFSPLRTDLPVLRRVHDNAVYERLAEWREARSHVGLSEVADDFFPIYRAPVIAGRSAESAEVSE